ncbi:MAG: CARDB domain-containing protein, partial [Nitrosotalea sp.]
AGFISEMAVFDSLKLRYAMYGIGSILVCLFMLTGNAYATDTQVTIVNGTSNNCLPYPSCYEPFEVDISPGSTVTWVNNDTRTHTATAGTPNYGPVGLFDSGQILPGHSFTQFFGTVGKYQYYDKVDMWPSGVVVVRNDNPTHAELGWVGGSLLITNEGNNASQGLVVTKQIENTGGTAANSIIFRLRILNDTGYLFYNNITTANVPAKQSSPVSFVWNNPQSGKYRLNFEAAADNLIGQTNESNDYSSDIISIPKISVGQEPNPISENFTLGGNATVPEFSSISYFVLVLSIASVIAISTRSHMRTRI